MGTRLAGKVAVVTGAGSARGIGRAIALALAREGADVVIAGGRSADAVREEIEALGRGALALPTDVARQSDVDELVERTLARFGQVDVLVNCAGILILGRLSELRLEDWERTLAVNLTGLFLCTQAVARTMIERGAGGRIVNISSLCGHFGCRTQVAYAASKAGVEGFTQSISLELAEHGITANAVAPGGIFTAMSSQPPPPGQAPVRWDGAPLPRSGLPDDVAGAVVFLASEEAAWITGTTIVVDGGQLARP
jgi:NAD(P)-dependent dehydrogenase (short-subunit alcohol dehydrogenase family)